MLNTYIASGRALESAIVAMRRAFVKGPIVVTVAAPKEVRSLKMNARHWLLMTLMAEQVRPEGDSYSKEAWHIYCKQKFLQPTEILLPNGKTALDYPSTSNMNVEEFSSFATQCEVFANEHGVILE